MEKNKREMKFLEDNLFCLGPYYSSGMYSDIKKSMITLARYKFASKMLRHMENIRVLELGCNEGLGAYFFMQLPNCVEYTGVDIDRKSILWCLENVKPQEKRYGKILNFVEADFLQPVSLSKKLKLSNSKDKERICSIGKKGDIQYEVQGGYGAIISLDVIEHIEKHSEQQYLRGILENLDDSDVAIIGTPNIAMSPFQSEETKKAHINMFDEMRLYNLCHRVFHNVFIFNMNDEVINTGFDSMSCYFFALCCNPKK